MRLRWEFRRYDHRAAGICYGRGWLHYAGVGPVLIVLGFHRGVIGWKTRAWFEFTLYAGVLSLSLYPGVRIPRRLV